MLVSNNEDSLDCVITFQTDSVLQKFMLRFEQLQLDCNDHLYIYDGAHVYSPYKVSSKTNVCVRVECLSVIYSEVVYIVFVSNQKF